MTRSSMPKRQPRKVRAKRGSSESPAPEFTDGVGTGYIRGVGYDRATSSGRPVREVR